MCHYVETSAAESFEAVDGAFRQLFRLAKATCQAFENFTLEPEIKRALLKTSRRRGSIKQKLFDYYRKTPTNPNFVPSIKALNESHEIAKLVLKSTKCKESGRNKRKASYTFPTKCQSLGVLIESDEEKHRPTHNETNENTSRKFSSELSWINRNNTTKLTSSTSDVIFIENTSDESSSTASSSLVDEFSEKDTFSNNKCYQPDQEKPNSAPHQSKGDIQQFFPTNRKASLLTEKELESNNASCVRHKLNSYSCKGKVNSSKQIFKMFKSAFGRDKSERCEFDKLTCCLSNDDETQNNKSLSGLTKIPFLQSNFTKKHQRRPSLREAVKLLIGTRNKAVDSVI